MGRLKTAEIHSLRVPEVRSVKSRRGQDSTPLEARGDPPSGGPPGSWPCGCVPLVSGSVIALPPSPVPLCSSLSLTKAFVTGFVTGPLG